MPISETDKIYFDNLQINEGAYFYSRCKIIKAGDIRNAFNKVKDATVGYKKICKVVKEDVEYDGKKAQVSLLVFYSKGTPPFLPISDPKLSLTEQTVGYVLIIEIGEHIACFTRHANGLSEFKKNLLLISPADLCGAIWKEGALFTRIHASNMNMNPLTLRNKSWEAFDLSAVISTAGTNHNAVNGVRMTKDRDAVSLSLNTSRVTKFASDKKHIKDLCKWCDEIINGILNPTDINESFLRHFAKPVKWRDYAKKLKPTGFLIDTFRLQKLIDDNDIHFKFENGFYGRELSETFIKEMINRMGGYYQLIETVPDKEYATSSATSPIIIKTNLTGIKIEAKGVWENIKVVDKSIGSLYANHSLFSLINSNRAFAVGFDKLNFTYCNGALHQDEGILNNLDRVLSIFHPLDRMSTVTSEKGEIVGKKDFQDKTVFNVVEEYFRNNGAVHIVCDDMGYEVADHIIVTDQSISFVHSKANGKKTSLSASNFQVVVGQALKNIGAVRDLDLNTKVAAWKDKRFKGSEIPVYRYGNIDNFSKDYSFVLGLPNGIKEICLAVDFISKKQLKEAFEKLNRNESFSQKNYVIQLIWLLNDLISACKEADMNCRIFCKE